ncbi:hypothetical protein B484DRAFT_406396 [Ochromonadaceae sp. CCMP2298]|nr:hypothetical protein B484DRAFT_406396 [Ochromonadaceae sp. CCMP2298]|mmetsp:Transcript_14230/g.31412  ORF Transcript_14230/g.31412 Transcript_14230/m.31412 type:complete len:126 (+) Transcript_14230:112-489(+)|eukprot:CAMPEP_0173179770 /NCGR_PEP_ID=MMETSP1141-20130122/6321_1 /TAXON_ID=483371 /ORGANISM="non described non described, Strain CCMP2298" /LENGTH=125 /DNA_ID=CAMNT_0014102499 /DNA_START=51 /DNA_END=428 /DNA_ORIENTATION=+
MGRVANNRRRTSKNKQFKKGHDTKRRPKDVDQIQDELKKEEEREEKMTFVPDEDLPGLGQHYCTPCGRHFADEVTLLKHEKCKLHKRRMRTVAEEQYTQAEADRGAGISKQINAPAHAVAGKMEE